MPRSIVSSALFYMIQIFCIRRMSNLSARSRRNIPSRVPSNIPRVVKMGD